ncbi:MAG: response regulator transcription factor [Rikenellaceae bacterium]
MKVLIIEDEVALAQTIERTLKSEGYTVEVAHTFAQARSKIGLFEYDCIMLDIMLPDGSGLDILQELKSMGRLGGVIIVSAKDSIDDKVKGLNMGADDYLAKPFHLSELTARVASIIRRNGNSGANNISIENTVIWLDKSQVVVGETLLDLSRKEYDILLHFAMRQGHVISKESLAEAVWGDFIDQADNFDFIYTHMKNLRRKLSAAGSQVEIKAIYGFGYKLN